MPRPTPTEARVTGHTLLSPRVALLSFAAADLVGRAFTPGDKVKLAAPGERPKSYTPARFDAETGTMDIVFHLHGNGPTALWAAAEPVGDVVAVFGPARSLRPVPFPSQRALFYGDETALGLARALADALPDPVTLDGVIELDDADLPAATALALSLGAPVRTPGDAARAHAEATPLDDDVVVYLSGRAETVKALHSLFLSRGLDRSRVVAKPYWSERGIGCRKEIAADVA